MDTVAVEPGTACTRCGQEFRIGDNIHAEGLYGAGLNLWYHDGGVSDCLTRGHGPDFKKVVRRLAVWALRRAGEYSDDGDDYYQIANALDKL